LSTALDRDRSPVCADAVEPTERLDAVFATANLLEGFRKGKRTTTCASRAELQEFAAVHERKNSSDLRFREDGRNAVMPRRCNRAMQRVIR
jgi:hypothetical protein